MLILAYTLKGLAAVLGLLLDLVFWLILIRALISWVNPDPFNPIVRFLTSSTDPLLRPVRKYIKPIGNFDLSPIVVICIILFLREALVGALAATAQRMLLGG